MRFGFVTCVRLGMECMRTIYSVGGKLDLAVTLPDQTHRNKSGRVYLESFCQQRQIPLVKSSNVNDPGVCRAVAEREIDWLFVIGWSQIVRPQLLAVPSRGVLGMHPTLLPEGRGRASIPWAILKGLPRTGVTLFQLDEGVDTGPIIAQRPIPLAADVTATQLYEDVATAHSHLLRDVWPDLVRDRVQAQPQDPNEGSSWPGRRPEDGLLRADMSVAEALILVRATTHPYPGAFWHNENGSTLRVWAAERCQSPNQRPTMALRDGRIEATDFQLEATGGPDPSLETVRRAAGAPVPAARV